MSSNSSVTDSFAFGVPGDGERSALLSRIQKVEAELAVSRRSERALLERNSGLERANVTLKRSLEALASQRELDSFLELVLRAITEQLAADSSMLWLAEVPAAIMKPFLVFRQGQVSSPANVYDPAAQGPLVLDISHAIYANLSGSRSPLIIEDVQFDQLLRPNEREYLLNLGTRTCMLLPLVFGEQLVGAFGLRFQQPRSFRAEELELAQALASQATLVLEVSRLADSAKEAAIARERERAAISRAAELSKFNARLRSGVARLADEPSTDGFLGHVLFEVISELDAFFSSLFLYDATTHCLWLHFRATPSGILQRPGDCPELALFRQPIPPGRIPLWSEAAPRRRAWFLDLEEVDTLAYVTAVQWFRSIDAKSVLFIPLLLGARPLGFISALFKGREPPEPKKIELVESMANQASLAMELTRLAEKAKDGAVLAERNRIACEIHDTLAQGLIGILMQIENAEQALEVAPEMVLDRLRHAKTLAQQNLAEARSSVWALRPGPLESGDLADALAQFTLKITAERSGSLRCEFNCEGLRRRLAANIETEILRIGQEALNNAVRHAQAKRLKATLIYSSDTVQLSVCDDGRGLSAKTEQPERKGFGLKIMEERAKRIGGTFAIRSSPHGGTTVTITAPIRE